MYGCVRIYYFYFYILCLTDGKAIKTGGQTDKKKEPTSLSNNLGKAKWMMKKMAQELFIYLFFLLILHLRYLKRKSLSRLKPSVVKIRNLLKYQLNSRISISTLIVYRYITYLYFRRIIIKLLCHLARNMTFRFLIEMFK